MKRFLSSVIFFLGLTVLYGQTPASPVSQLDDMVKNLAAEVQRRIPAGGTPKISTGSWTYRDMLAPLGSYWSIQLSEELTNLPNRSFTVVPTANADWTLSGEIVELANIVRIYTRLIRSGDYSIAASFHSDIENNEYLAEMLSGGGSGDSSSVSRDVYEPDSRTNPVTVVIASSEDGTPLNRSIHTGGDQDFFLLEPQSDGALVIETSGSTDTYLELYNANSSRESLAENDDGGSGSNARIRHEVQAGNRYIAMVRGYSNSTTGRYSFLAYLMEPVRTEPDEFESDDEFSSARDIAIDETQQHTFTNGDDVDWVKFQVTAVGTYAIRTRGVNSTRLDTYIELYDQNHSSIDENDDGGDNLDSYLSVRLQPGTYYLMVSCLNSEPEEPYTIRITRE
jgi:hypothetical protein